MREKEIELAEEVTLLEDFMNEPTQLPEHYSGLSSNSKKPMLPAVSNEDEVARQLKDANIVFNHPKTMEDSDDQTIEKRIAKNSHIVEAELKPEGNKIPFCIIPANAGLWGRAFCGPTQKTLLYGALKHKRLLLYQRYQTLNLCIE